MGACAHTCQNFPPFLFGATSAIIKVLAPNRASRQHNPRLIYYVALCCLFVYFIIRFSILLIIRMTDLFLYVKIDWYFKNVYAIYNFHELCQFSLGNSIRVLDTALCTQLINLCRRLRINTRKPHINPTLAKFAPIYRHMYINSRIFVRLW